MSKFNNTAAQGDIFFIKVDSLPGDAVKQKDKNKEYVVAHSESGHCHVISSDDVDFYESANDPFECYLVVHKETNIVHLKTGPDRHKDITFKPGNVYRVRRQGEEGPEGWRRAID